MFSYLKRKLHHREESADTMSQEKMPRLDYISVTSFVRFDPFLPEIFVGASNDHCLIIGVDPTCPLVANECMQLPFTILPEILRSIRYSFSKEEHMTSGCRFSFQVKESVREVTYGVASSSVDPRHDGETFTLSSTGTTFTVNISRRNVANFFIGLEQLCIEILCFGRPCPQYFLWEILDNPTFVGLLKTCEKSGKAIRGLLHFWAIFSTENKGVILSICPELEITTKQLVKLGADLFIYKDLMNEIQENNIFIEKR